MKTIQYKGRVVFKKVSLPAVKRLKREYYENEACFAFVVDGEYQIRDQTQTLAVNNNTALLAKCTNYFYEAPVHRFVQDSDGAGAYEHSVQAHSSQAQSTLPQKSTNKNQVIGVFLYPDIFQGLFDMDLSQSNHTVDYNIKQVEVNQLLAHYRDSIDILLESPELADDLLIENKLKEFVILMTKTVKAPSEVDFLAAMFKPHFAKFEAVIQRNLYADLNLQELADLCHMSVSTFKRKFKQAYGDSPMKYITRLKIDKAVALLRTDLRTDSHTHSHTDSHTHLSNGLRISEIAFQTGFESVSTFNRSFKAQMGQSPSEYRLSGYEQALSLSDK